ncbi:MAG: FAD-dependent oxidoreductase [Candidatus Kapaibacteriota bacterium]
MNVQLSAAHHHAAFLSYMQEQHPDTFLAYQELHTANITGIRLSQILIDTAIVLEHYLQNYISDSIGFSSIKSALQKEQLVIKAKADFTKKALIRRRGQTLGEEAISDIDGAFSELLHALSLEQTNDKEYDFSAIVLTLLSQESEQKELLDTAEILYFSMREHNMISDWISEFAGKKLDFDHLEHAIISDIDGITSYDAHHHRKRDGFALTDRRGTRREVTKQIDYCMICHEREKDSCSKGIHEKDGTIKKNPLGVETKGCPLDEKISEMHFLRREGYPLAALAMVMLDNPMCAGTGHRICNDCMKGCIFQKQEPVNIPKIETSVLSDILSLNDGLELYALLMEWNPLNVKRPYALPYNGNKVLVVGLGPAGYTLSHYLLNEGFAVVAVEGLKIESALDIYALKKDDPLPSFKDTIERELDERIISGFGGVSEYGITSRWDKNFLTVLQLLLERRKNFKILDGVRFGGTLTIEDAWKLGFTHVALATGAGKPTLIRMKNNLSRGLRKASDFLMALQLTGAARMDSMANLQVSLPAIVIGGGLTAIDTATETLAYYPIQVEKFYLHAKTMLQEVPDYFEVTYDAEERTIAQTFFEHGKIIHEVRNEAKRLNQIPDFLPYLKEWGGVTLIYRKQLKQSPAYKLNHEEVNEALEEGISIYEELSPIECILDSHGAIEAVKFEHTGDDKKGSIHVLTAKTVFVAAGTSPNTTYEKEYPQTFRLMDSGYYQPYTVIG